MKVRLRLISRPSVGSLVNIRISKKQVDQHKETRLFHIDNLFDQETVQLSPNPNGAFIKIRHSQKTCGHSKRNSVFVKIGFFYQE